MKPLSAAITAHANNAAGEDDPFAGVVSPRAFLYSTDKSGRKFGPKRDGMIKVRRDGYSSARSGSCSVEARDDLESGMATAGLSPGEREAWRHAVKGANAEQVAAAIGIKAEAARTRVTRARRKMQEAAKVVAGMGR